MAATLGHAIRQLREHLSSTLNSTPYIQHDANEAWHAAQMPFFLAGESSTRSHLAITVVVPSLGDALYRTSTGNLARFTGTVDVEALYRVRAHEQIDDIDLAHDAWGELVRGCLDEAAWDVTGGLEITGQPSGSIAPIPGEDPWLALRIAIPIAITLEG